MSLKFWLLPIWLVASNLFAQKGELNIHFHKNIEKVIELKKESERPNVLVYSGKDLTDVQSELLNQNVEGLIKKDEVSINQLPGLVTKILKKD